MVAGVDRGAITVQASTGCGSKRFHVSLSSGFLQVLLNQFLFSSLVQFPVYNVSIVFYFVTFFSLTGVSNWGGYAVACALYILNNCEIHDRYLRKAVGSSKLSKKTGWAASALPSVAKVFFWKKIVMGY